MLCALPCREAAGCLSAARREALKRAAALGLSAPLAGLMVRGAAAQGTPEARPMGWSIPTPEGLRTDLTGQSISVIMGADGPVVPWEERAVAVFSEATGIQVERISGPQQATERIASYLQLLGAQASDVDAMQIDVIWPGILAPHALDLTETLASQGVEYFERIVTNNTVEGLLVGIPWFTDAGLLYYRTDLLEKYGYEGPPETWAQLQEWAQAIQDGERSANPDFWGFVWQGNAYEGLTCDALEWQVSNGGGNIIEPDGTVSVNNPQAIAAFERARGWVGTISPEGVTTYNEEASRGVWQAGNAAFMRNWPYAYSPGQQPDESGAVPVISGQFDVTVLPMGDGADARHADTLGGWQFMASKYSQSPDAAIEFCKFMTSLPMQRSFAVEHSRLPTIPSLYDDADVLAANPFFARLKDVFLGGAVARPSTVAGELYNDVSIAYFTAVNQILTGQAEAAGAVADLAEEFEGLMAEL